MVHSHGLHGGHHHHHHDADGDHDHAAAGGGAFWLRAARYALAGLCVLVAGLAASMVMVPAGEAVVITRFGDPVRVLTAPGLAWKLPPPVESVIAVDLRLRTTSTGVQDVGTRDGLRILVQAYVAWQVPADPARVTVFLRAARNDPDEAARQLRSLVGAALHVTASGFDLADLVNTDPAKVQLESFEARLRAQLAPQLRAVYGIELRQFGIERLSLPEETMAATVGRMRAERETVAAARAAEGLRQAAGIRAEADRQSKELLAAARTEAAGIEASAQAKAAQIQAEAYQGDPALYDMLRSLDAITLMVNSNTRLILRGDSPPFKTLTEGPAP